MNTNPPDLRLMSAELVKKLGFPESEVARLRGCPGTSLSLVMLRVIIAEMKRRGLLTHSEEDHIINLSRPPLDPMAIMVPVQDAKNSTNTPTVDEIIRGVDALLSAPATRTKIPGWFVNDFWPAALRHLANGGRLTERDQAIAINLLAEVYSS